MPPTGRYQNGTIEKESTRRDGLVWYIRFTEQDGRRPRTRIGRVADLPTRQHARRAAADLIKTFNEHALLPAPRTMGDVIERYIREEIPARQSTARGYRSYLDNYVKPRWSKHALSDVRANDVRQWLMALPLAKKTQNHILNMMRLLFRFAMLWEWLPLSDNPMSLFSIRGGTRRKIKPLILSTDEFLRLVAHINREPYVTMMLLAASLGVSCSELCALQWHDMDFTGETVIIRRAMVDGVVDDVKTEARWKRLPMHPRMIARMLDFYRDSEFKEADDWVFASPHTSGEKPYHINRIQQYVIAPAARELGLAKPIGEGPQIGWHTLRHSYRAWLDATGAPLGVQRDLMRHADIRTTMNIYGDSFMSNLRDAQSKAIGVILQ